MHMYYFAGVMCGGVSFYLYLKMEKKHGIIGITIEASASSRLRWLRESVSRAEGVVYRSLYL